LDNAAFAEIVSMLSAEETGILIEGATADQLRKYGLDDPSFTAEFSYSSGRTEKYLLGIYNTQNKKYYFSEASAPDRVYMVSSAVKTAIDVTVKDMLLWDGTPSVTSAKVTSLTFEKAGEGGRKLVYTYYPNGKSADYTDAYNWYLSTDGSDEIRVGKEFADELNSAVTSLGFRDCVHFTGEPDPAYGLDSSTLMTLAYNRTDTVTDSTTGTQKEVTVPAAFTLCFGNMSEDGSYYVSTGDSGLVYTLYDSDVFAKLIAADRHEVMPLTAEDLNYRLVDRAELSFSGKTLDLGFVHDTSGAEKTVYRDGSGREIPEELVTAFTEKLHALKAASFTDMTDPGAGAGEILFSAKFSFNTEGTAPETLSVGTYADGLCRVSFAGRDDQLVSRESVDELIEAASALAG
ncbi:MAG: DUF4340 domain-containing protein, partial [Clostridia bacterium]|nr:DUF4340 domain-containing protein [Clostridia bacterium]